MKGSGKRRLTRRGHALNALLSGALVLGICVVGNLLARDHLAFRRDFSADQIYSVSPATRRILGALEDELLVEAYFTGEARHAAVQVARGRLLGLLRELQAAAGGRLELRFRDPNTESEARLAAERYGIVRQPLQGYQGTARVTQNLYLGLVLRYRGREQVLPFVLPQTLELGFASALRHLQREQAVRVGFVTGDGRVGAEDESFQTARDVLALRHRVVPVTDLGAGEPVPEEIDVLLVVQPLELHPRVAFAVDQFVQRGGRAILCVENLITDVASSSALAVRTGLEGVLAAWGVPLSAGLVWDLQCNVLTGTRAGSPGTRERLEYPYWPRVEPDGMAEGHPVTARLPRVGLFWCGALLEREAPPGVERTDLLQSSERSWLVPPLADLAIDAENLSAQATELLVRGGGRRHALAAALTGPLPSAFAAGAPEPHDPVAWAVHQRAVREAVQAGEEPPAFELGTTDEAVTSAEREARVVIVADTDWLADGNTFTPESRLFLENLVDWLSLEHDLMAIRSRIPQSRRIRDFEGEELEKRGVAALQEELGDGAAERVGQLQTEAARAAARRRFFWMGIAVLGSLALFAAATAPWLLTRLAAGRKP